MLADPEQLEPQLIAHAGQLGREPETHADQSGPQLEKVPICDEMFKKRFGALEPLHAYEAPHHGPRVTIVTASINSGSFQGVRRHNNYSRSATCTAVRRRSSPC